MAETTREVVEQCDHLIDLHGGDLDESLRPYSYWTVTGNMQQDAISKEMVLAFGLVGLALAVPTAGAAAYALCSWLANLLNVDLAGFRTPFKMTSARGASSFTASRRGGIPQFTRDGFGPRGELKSLLLEEGVKGGPWTGDRTAVW